jgi:hypothetical protein
MFVYHPHGIFAFGAWLAVRVMPSLLGVFQKLI